MSTEQASEFSLYDEPVTDEMLLDRYKDHRLEIRRLRKALKKIAERCDRRRGDDLSMSLTWIQNKAHDTFAAAQEPDTK